MSFRAFILLALLVALTKMETAEAAQPQVAGLDGRSRVPYAERADVRAFAAEVADDSGLSPRQVERWLAAAKFQPRIVAAMDRPLLLPPKWYEYAPRLLAADRVNGGVAFWRANAEALTRAEEEFGVPPEYIVAILGIETIYGSNAGSYRVIDALVTLAFDYPRRATFFRGELREYLLLAHAQGWSPLKPTGSFAGAMGTPQFMPGSYRRYAVDFDGDGKVDLWRSNADVIGSVGNYLARHDWTAGQPVLLPARIAADTRDAALRRLDGGISERRPLAAWQADGVDAVGAPVDLAAEPVGLLLLEEPPENGESRASYWIACPNFYVVTRYNKSRLYAAAVFALAQSVKRAHDAP
ncbi:MAG TPA: lytic murein transglycosylase B [Casimicrobiaceae bacterium]|nr:lytic murein transglycosylase B [Casimicrobiaceae bacterium]